MKKRYIFAVIAVLITIVFFCSLFLGSDKSDEISSKSNMPRIGQYLWTYNMNKREWHEYSQKVDELESKEDIILQLGYPEGNGGYTVYHLTTENAQVKKDDFWLGEGSQEFIIDKNLYSYFPKVFEIYQVSFNGANFGSRMLSINEIQKLFKDTSIIKVSELKKGDITLKFSKKNNKYMVVNDTGETFYKYYIIPNDSKKMQIEDFSNQFKVFAPVDIKLQRIEGCSKSFPCYNIHIK